MGDRNAVALEAPPTPPDQWMGADQGEVVPPQPHRPKPPRPDPTLICDMVNYGDALHHEFTGERAPWPAHDPVVRGCRWLNQQTNRFKGWLLDQAGRLVNRLADHLQAPTSPTPTPTPGPEYPVTPGAEPTLEDDTGHARDQARDPQCSQGRQPAVGHCTADGTYVPPPPTRSTRVPPPYTTPVPEPTPTPTRTSAPPPPAPAPTPTPTPTLRPAPTRTPTPPPAPPPYVPPPYVPPPTPTPPPPTPTPAPTPTAHPDPPKPRPRLLNNRCVGRAFANPNNPLAVYLACMAEGGWTP